MMIEKNMVMSPKMNLLAKASSNLAKTEAETPSSKEFN
jgi:hypothetical protein